MKHLSLLLLTLFIALNQSFSQDWKPYNHSYIYFYQASNTGDYFTLRHKNIELEDGETLIHFIDNYIPCDTLLGPYEETIYFAQNGSVLGDSMLIINDTTWLDNTIKFVNHMTLGETLPYSSFDGTDITYTGASDTVLFEVSDSVKYYAISDGSELIQSKSFGFIHYPKPHSDSTIFYELVGIENYVGLGFDHHNEIFDFEIGDKFFYRNSYFSVYYDLWGNHYSSMEILDKYEIEGHYFYDVTLGGGTYSNFPRNVDGNTDYDYPGEPVRYCRACDVVSGTVYNMVMDENDEYQLRIGHRYVTNPETGNIIQLVGFGELDEGYETIENFVVNPNSLLKYEFEPYGQDDFLHIGGWDRYDVIYEAGFGLVKFDASMFEDGYHRRLIGAIKSGDTLGTINASIHEEHLIDFNTYPNPTTRSINFNENLSSIQIFDISGKQVFYLHDSVNQIDISGLESGSYIINAKDITGRRRVARFVKK